MRREMAGQVADALAENVAEMKKKVNEQTEIKIMEARESIREFLRTGNIGMANEIYTEQLKAIEVAANKSDY